MRREPPPRSIAIKNLLAIIAFFIVLGIAAANAEGGTNERAIRKVFGKKAEAAIRVARCESRMNPRALGSAGERGLFQIHPVHFAWAKPGRLFNPTWNAKVAYRLSRGGTNWSHWTCRWAA